MAALVAILALVVAIPFERARSCGVCPVDCPMHAARRPAGKVGCHHGSTTTAPADDGACAMRSACGHQGGATEVVFHGTLVPETVVRAVVIATRAFVAIPDPKPGGAPAPLDHPPESVRV
jgi:hypothetical protein